MAVFEELASAHPELKRKLLMAKLTSEPAAYLRKTTISALLLAGLVCFAYLLFSKSFGFSLVFFLLLAFISFFLFYSVLVHIVDIRIRKYAREIDREVLFAGRFLLVKLNAGRPLVLALMEASKSYGVANKHFKEIVHDIDIGTPLEEAIAKATRYTPSERFRHILFQINNALRIGVDVTATLEAVLDEIAEEQLLEIQRYGKKLNSLTMFYMLFSIVIPSLGITLFVTLMSMFSAEFDLSFFLLLAGGLFILELFFVSIFKSIRPNVNL